MGTRQTTQATQAARTARTARTGRAPALRDSMEQVWLAGLGALAVAEEEGERFFRTLKKRGEGIERTLVKKGAGLEKELVQKRAGIERAGRERLRQVTTAAEDATGGAIGRLGAGFDGAMTTVLHRLGVPTAKEIASLTRRVETLTTTLAKGQKTRRPPAKRPATRRARAVTVPATTTVE